jgi:hypothetical protein
MNEEEYLSQRLEDQMGYYDRQSQRNQVYYKRTKFIEEVSRCSINIEESAKKFGYAALTSSTLLENTKATIRLLSGDAATFSF